MTEESIETVVEIEENDPVYYKPGALNLVSTISGILSWVVLVVIIADMVVQVLSLQAQLTSQNLVLTTLISEPSFISYSMTNIFIPLFMGLGLFMTLQGVAIALNVLLEIDFNMREPKN
jgi:hypothetical protein